MAVAPGTRIGTYEITAALGAGGMGEVYRARDTRLKREVAIKVLPAGVATDPERLARFQREAEVLASLNHPHIAHVYGIEDGALVMELVEGEDLSQRIARGPIPVDEALPIARQIAEALEAAHDAGVVHRDLKPANIKVRGDGTIKVLDFGLAKAFDPASGIGERGSPELANSPTITSPATQRGVILGTAAYMAPEQAKGRAVDKRADIWAFGCVLYEMLSRRRAFQGEDASDTIAEVLKSAVNLAALPADTPVRVRELIERCLQRDARMRLRDIGEARIALSDGRAIGAAESSRRWPRLGERVGWLVAIVLAAVLSGIVRQPTALPTGASVRFSIDIGADFGSLTATLTVFTAASPDGTMIALSRNDASGIYVRDLSAEQLIRVEGTGGSRGMAWSPDSQSIAFVVNGELKAATLGGSVRTLATVPMTSQTTTIAWSPNGSIVVASTQAPLHVLRPGSTVVEPLGALDTAAGEVEQATPVFHPDGRRLFYQSHREGNRFTTRFRSLDSPEFQELVERGDRIIWAGADRVMLRRGNALYAQPMSYSPLALSGDPVQLAGDLEAEVSTLTSVIAASPTVMAYRTAAAIQHQLTWIDRNGQPIARIGPVDDYQTFALSPDGARIAVSRREGSARNIWLMDGVKGTMTRVTLGPFVDTDPRFAADGRSIIFSSTRDPSRSPYRVTLGSQAPELLIAFKGRPFALDDLSADGRWLIYHEAVGTSGLPAALKALPLDRLTDQPIVVAPALTGTIDQGVMSRDGRWVAFNSNESGRTEVFVVPFPPTGDRWQVALNGGVQPVWRSDGRELYFLAPDGTLMAVPISPGTTFKPGNPVRLFQAPVRPVHPFVEQYATASDGRRFLFVAITEDRVRLPLTIITNWQQLTNK